jgi:hypothetical protein
MPLAGFEPIIPASERQQIRALERAGTVTGNTQDHMFKIMQYVGKILQREISDRKGEMQSARIESLR